MSKELKVEIKKLLRSLGLLVLFLVVVFGVNLLVDPANLASDRYAQQAAEIMASGQNVTNLRNLDDRELIRQYAALRTQPVEVLVLGSSRSMQVTKELTGVENTFCAGVTGADLRDGISTYMLFREQGLQPEKVVLCADYWFLSQGNLDARALTEGYEAFCAQTQRRPLRTASRTQARLKELASFSYFQSSIELLLKDRGRLQLAASEAADNLYATRRADGSYSYEQAYRTRGAEAIEKDAAENCIYNALAASFSGVDAELCAQMEAFIALMQADGVEVVLQLAPVHPVYYAHMEKDPAYAEILTTEDYFYAVAEKYGIACYGGYDPAEFGMTGEDFYDAQHPSADGMYAYFGIKRRQSA